MYVLDRMKAFRGNNPYATKKDETVHQRTLLTNWKKLPLHSKEIFKAEARKHDMRQPLIKDAIIRCFQENPAKGFVAVEKGILRSVFAKK